MRIGITLLAIATACSTSPSQSISPLDSALPLPTLRAMPTPSTPDTATVGGVALRQIAGQPAYPLNGGALLLAEVRYFEGKPVMAVVDEDTAPRTVADEQGFFVFVDVPPGKYVLVYATPMGSVVLRDPRTGADMIIEVRGGATIDLGELKYNLGF